MKKIDEDLQHQFEKGDFSAEGIDSHAYRKVFNALQKEPNFSLPTNFADKLVAQIEALEKSKDTSRDNWWLGLGLFSFFIAFIIAAIFSGFKPSAGAFGFFSGHSGLVVFGVAFIVLLNWLDKKVVRKSVQH
jgi:uncharacterized membrane-anchored protein